MSPIEVRAGFNHRNSSRKALFCTPCRFPVGLALLAWVSFALFSVDVSAQSMASKALGSFLQQSGLSSRDEVLWSEVPCNDTVCVQAGLSGVSRGAALRQLSQIVAGFGYGVDVQFVSWTTSVGGHNTVDLEVQFQADDSKVGSDEVRRRAQHIMEFLKFVSLLSPPQTAPFDPSKVAKNSTLLFLYEFSWNASTHTVTGTLLAPPGAKANKPSLPKARCTKSTLDRDGKAKVRPFENWHRLTLQWRRVCEGTQGGIQ